MTELLERAVEAVRRENPEVQDRVAEAMLMLIDEGRNEALPFDAAELKKLWREGIDSGPGRFADIEEIKREARHRLEIPRADLQAVLTGLQQLQRREFATEEEVVAAFRSFDR